MGKLLSKWRRPFVPHQIVQSKSNKKRGQSLMLASFRRLAKMDRFKPNDSRHPMSLECLDSKKTCFLSLSLSLSVDDKKSAKIRTRKKLKEEIQKKKKKKRREANLGCGIEFPDEFLFRIEVNHPVWWCGHYFLPLSFFVSSRLVSLFLPLRSSFVYFSLSRDTLERGGSDAFDLLASFILARLFFIFAITSCA